MYRSYKTAFAALKKTTLLVLVLMLALNAAKAQISANTATVDTIKLFPDLTMPTVFDGTRQYNTWSIGGNIGATFPFLLSGGTNATRRPWTAGPGCGLSLRKRLAHSFSLQLDLQGGKVKGNDGDTPGMASKNNGFEGQGFNTRFFSATMSGLVNVASMDFLHRKNAVNFYGSVGAGLIFYKPTWYDNAGFTAPGNPHTYNNTVKELVIPVGGLIKFKLNDALALNVGYNMNFIDGTNFSGFHTVKLNSGQIYHDHYAYAYGGIEYTLGSKAKKNMDWVNPADVIYDQLYDPALREEIKALQVRVANVENAIHDLKTDADGDGVGDQFDKCPNTPADVVDGSGCTIIFSRPSDSTIKASSPLIAYQAIEFDFQKVRLSTVDYPNLKSTATNLMYSSASVEITGHTSTDEFADLHPRLSHGKLLEKQLEFSKKRANKVKQFLVNLGVDPSKIKVNGYGSTQPRADNSTDDGRVYNRRVELKRK